MALVLARLAVPKRLVDVVETFHQLESWVSTIFNDICTHLRVRYEAKPTWAFQNPECLSTYCSAIHQNGEASGLIWGFFDGTHQRICGPACVIGDLSTLAISMHTPWCDKEFLHPMGCWFMPVDPLKDERMTGQFHCSLNCNLNSAHTASTTKKAVSTYMVIEDMHLNKVLRLPIGLEEKVSYRRRRRFAMQIWHVIGLLWNGGLVDRKSVV